MASKILLSLLIQGIIHQGSSEAGCAVGEKLCGSQCYDPSKKICTGGNVCQPGQVTCGWKCHSATDGSTCHKNSVVCLARQKLCGWECYDPATQTCNNDAKVCKAGEAFCGERNCYNVQKEICHHPENYQAIPCPKIQKACGRDCYTKGESVCHKIEGGEIACKVAEEVCGYNCYSRAAGFKCIDDRSVCKTEQELCAGACYDPKAIPHKTCLDNMVLCEDGQVRCGRKCMNTATHRCAAIKDGDLRFDDFGFHERPVRL